MMRIILISICYFQIFVFNPAFSQTACGQVEDASIDDCNQGIGLGGLTVYQGVCGGGDVYFTMSSAPISVIPMCDGSGVLNNPSYFAFIADGTSLFSVTVVPIPGSCSEVGGFIGIQGALVTLGGCNTINPIGTCMTTCTTGPLSLQTNDIPPPGTVIILVLDGCNGSFCDVKFSITSGWTNNPQPPDDFILEQSQLFSDCSLGCGEVTFTVEPEFEGICDYIWRLPDGTSVTTVENSITINVNNLPSGNICVQGFNEDCFPGEFFPASNSVCFPLVREELEVDIASDPTWCGKENGFAYIMLNNGVAPYTYLWSNGGVFNYISGVSSGQYYVTVNDANGCEIIDSVYIESSESVQAAIVVVQPDCGESNGSIKVNSWGGSNMGYNYRWLPDFWINADSLVDLSKGIYSVTVSDPQDESCATIISNIGIFNEIKVDIEEIYHSDLFLNNGFIRFNVQNGVEYKYYLTTPNGVQEGNESKIENLSPGKYNLEIISLLDAECKFNYEFVIKGFNRPEIFISEKNADFDVFPNPFQDILFFGKSGRGGNYDLITITGEVVHSGILKGDYLDLSNFPAGLYFLQVNFEESEMVIKKIVKLAK